MDCSTSPLLLCSTHVRKFQGTGSRLFFLGRCLTHGLTTKRAVVLTSELPSTSHILEPFEPWSNCTLHDTKVNKRGNRILSYSPMYSTSLRKTADMPAAGALYPPLFAERGYWWWKAQEISYALRPKELTLKLFEQSRPDLFKASIAVFQIRRTDKTGGCLKAYGITNLFPLY